MIQRIQTLYLLLAAVALVIALFLPLGTAAIPDLGPTSVNALSPTDYCPIGYAAVLILSALIAIAAIFLWKNRPLQVRTSIFNIFIMVVSYLVFFVYKMANTGVDYTLFGYALLLPAVAIVFTALAVRGIRRDENLIRSLNRIR